MPYMTACVGLCAAFAAGVRKQPPARSQAFLGTLLGAFGEAEIPCTKSAESDGFPGTLKNRISLGKRGQHRGAKRSRRKTWRFMRQAGHFHPQCGRFSRGCKWRCSLMAHSQMTLFPLEVTIFSVGKAFRRTLPGFSGHANDNIPIILPQRPGYSPALPVCCVVGRRR